MSTSNYGWLLIGLGWLVVGGIWFFLIHPLSVERREEEARKNKLKEKDQRNDHSIHQPKP